MLIKLDEIYSIGADKRQFILLRKVRDRFINDSYFTSLEGLLKDYLSVKIRVSSVKSVKELLAYQEMLITALNEALQPLHIELHSPKNPVSNSILQEPSKTIIKSQEVQNES